MHAGVDSCDEKEDECMTSGAWVIRAEGSNRISGAGRTGTTELSTE
jgi:hypothetical protein